MSKRKKNPAACVNPACVDVLQDMFSCFACKSSYHFSCGNMDSNIIQLLEDSTSKGLSWYIRCKSCINTGVPDPLSFSFQSSFEELNNSLTSKVDEVKTQLNSQIQEIKTQLENSILVDVRSSFDKMFDDFKSLVEKSGLSEVSPPSSSTSTSVSVQTDDIPSQPNTLSSDNTVPPLSSSPKTEETVQSIPPRNVTQNVCPHYKKGKCPNGASGKNMVDGKLCMYAHPRKCLRYCRFGTDAYKGCSGSCNLLHPVLCKNSLSSGQCLLQNCTFAHLVGTKRHITPILPSTHDNNYNTHFLQTNGVSVPHNYHFSTPWNTQTQYPNVQYQGSQRTIPPRNYRYNDNNFPPLQNREEEQVRQLITIKDLQDSVHYILQNSASSSFQASGHPRPSQSTHQNFALHRPGLEPPLQTHELHSTEAKNYFRQNQQHPVT